MTYQALRELGKSILVGFFTFVLLVALCAVIGWSVTVIQAGH
jgi:hypothetical protein